MADDMEKNPQQHGGQSGQQSGQSGQQGQRGQTGQTGQQSGQPGQTSEKKGGQGLDEDENENLDQQRRAS